MIRKRTLLIAISVQIILIAGFLGIFHFTGQNKTYDLQLGKSISHEFPKIIDDGTEFMNDSTLIALAVFPDGKYKKNLLRAHLYVTGKGDTAVLQEEYIRVTEDLAGYEMRLKNLKWPPGEYTLYFKVGTVLEKSIDFLLR